MYEGNYLSDKVEQSKPIHQKHLNYNLKKQTDGGSNLYVRDNFIQLSENLHKDFVHYTRQSQKILEHQKHFNGERTFQFMAPTFGNTDATDNNTKVTKQTQQQNQKQLDLDESSNNNISKFNYVLPNGNSFQVEVGKKFDIKELKKKELKMGEKLKDQRPALNDDTEIPFECQIQNIYNYKEQTGGDKIPDDFTKQLINCFQEVTDFIDNLQTDDKGQLQVGEWEFQMMRTMHAKRDVVLKHDIVDRGRKAQLGSQFTRELGTGGHKEGLENLERDLQLLFADETLKPINKQVLNDLEDMEINADDLKFKDIMNWIAERATPDQLLYGFDRRKFGDPVDNQEWKKQFDSFKVNSDDFIKQMKIKDQMVDNFNQTEELKPTKADYEQQKINEKKKQEQFNLFQRVKREVEQIKVHKKRYQSDKTYMSLLNSHVIKKINELWPLVKEEEHSFQGFQNLQQSIEAIYQHVQQIQGKTTVEGNLKAEVLFWMMQEYKELLLSLDKSDPLAVLHTQFGQHLILNQNENPQQDIEKLKILTKSKSSDKIKSQSKSPMRRNNYEEYQYKDSYGPFKLISKKMRDNERKK